MDLLDLRSALVSALSSHLGTYTLGNSNTTQAVSVRDPGKGLEAGTTVTGLELIIASVAELEQQSQYKDSNFLQTWNIYLIDWGGADLEAASAVVQAGFPGTTSTGLSVSEDTGPRRQNQLRIPLSRVGGQSAFQVPPSLQVLSVNGDTGHVSIGINDMNDVTPTSGLDDDAVLVWDSATSKWKTNEHTSWTLTDGGNF